MAYCFGFSKLYRMLKSHASDQRCLFVFLIKFPWHIALKLYFRSENEIRLNALSYLPCVETAVVVGDGGGDSSDGGVLRRILI